MELVKAVTGYRTYCCQLFRRRGDADADSVGETLCQSFIVTDEKLPCHTVVTRATRCYKKKKKKKKLNIGEKYTRD